MIDPAPWLGPLVGTALLAAVWSPPLRSAQLPLRALVGVLAVLVTILCVDALGAPALPDKVLTRQIAAVGAIFYLGTFAASSAIGWTLGRLHLPPPAALGPPGAGRVIGILERALLIAVFPVGGADAVAIVFAAKQIARLPALQSPQATAVTAEYLLVGSLLSVSVGLLGGVALEYVVS